MAENVKSSARLPGFKAASAAVSLWDIGDLPQLSVPLFLCLKSVIILPT